MLKELVRRFLHLSPMFTHQLHAVICKYIFIRKPVSRLCSMEKFTSALAIHSGGSVIGYLKPHLIDLVIDTLFTIQNKDQGFQIRAI